MTFLHLFVEAGVRIVLGGMRAKLFVHADGGKDMLEISFERLIVFFPSKEQI